MSRSGRRRRQRVESDGQQLDDVAFGPTKRLQLHTPSAASDDHTAGRLCQRCTSIDFRAIYRMDPTGITTEGIPVADIGYITAADALSDCSLHAMVARILSDQRSIAFPDTNQTFRCHLRVFSCLSALGLARTRSRLARSPSLVIAVVPRASNADIDILTRDSALAAGLILPTTDAGNGSVEGRLLSYVGRTVLPTSIDFGLLRDWINTCRNEHPACSKSLKVSGPANTVGTATFKSLMVIDCETRTMEQLPHGSSYVAMSYVWGPATSLTSVDTVPTVQELSYNQPQAVEDAMTVVRNLGERYLWLDRYSIDQKDEEAKQQAILNMADIFEKSLVTIVSLASNVDVGLWGVSSTKRKVQPSVSTGKLDLVSSGPVLEDVLLKSVWSTRGWTLQEALLARRLLIFSEDQVYWKCSSITERECVQQPRAEHAGRKRTGPALDPDVFSETNQYRKRFGEMPLPLYARQVAEYTKRELSYDRDALHAFRAIVSRAKERTFWGVPIFLERETLSHRPVLSDTGFLLGLIWSRSAHQWYKPWQEFGKIRKTQAGRREGFPSWSWTSTRHCVQLDPISFDRHDSNKHGQLSAAAYRHSPYSIPHVKVSVPGHRSLTQAIDNHLEVGHAASVRDEKPLESVISSKLIFNGLVVPWNGKILSSASQCNIIDVELQFPEGFRPTHRDGDWFRKGVLFLDYDAEIDAIQQQDFIGTALLLVGFRRHGYNWQRIAWWMAISPSGDCWRRIGLIRSVLEMLEPKHFDKGLIKRKEEEHHRPFLPVSHSLVAADASLPEWDELKAYAQAVVIT